MENLGTAVPGHRRNHAATSRRRLKTAQPCAVSTRPGFAVVFDRFTSKEKIGCQRPGLGSARATRPDRLVPDPSLAPDAPAHQRSPEYGLGAYSGSTQQ